MDNERYKLFGYEITTDPDFMDERNAMTPELRDIIEDLYLEIMIEKGGKKSIKKLLELIERFPKNPQLKNFLTVAYVNAGDTEKAFEANHWLQAEHPDYLFGKLNQAAEYHEAGEYEKMPGILGHAMEIQGLYPDRTKFHLSEVTGFYKIAILYLIATGNLEAAQGRLDIMQEIAPGHPDTEFAAERILLASMEQGAAKWEEHEKTRIRVTPVPNSLPVQTDKPPVFANDIINRLYENGLHIPRGLLQEILNLPRKSLIADLELILNDALCRYEFFVQEVNDMGWDEELMNFPFHALMLLAELRASESLPKVLEILRQDEEFLEFWFGDHLTETLWQPLYYLGNQQLDLLKKFVLEPGVDTYAKTAVATALTQIHHHQPERKEEVIQWFSEVFDFFINSRPEDNVIDSDTIGLFVSDVIELDYETLLPQIKKLFDKNYVSEMISGDYASVKKDIYEESKYPRIEDLLSIFDRYEHITTTWSGYIEDDDDGLIDDDPSYDDYEDLPLTEPVRTTPKIGRNEPCPCGSGKKYKKCCMNKNL